MTVSSDVDGIVRRVRADLGDRATAGTGAREIDPRSCTTTSTSNVRLTRALTKYGAADSDHLPRVEDTPNVRVI